MKQKINAPIAIAILVVVLLLLFGGLYKKYMYQPTYSVEDIAAKFKAHGAGTQAPPNMRQSQQNGNR